MSVTHIHYLDEALRYFSKAQAESDPVISAGLERSAFSFMQLAEQAERNAQSDITYDRQPR